MEAYILGEFGCQHCELEQVSTLHLCVCMYLGLGRDCGKLQESCCCYHQKVAEEMVLLTHEKCQVVPCLFFY